MGSPDKLSKNNKIILALVSFVIMGSPIQVESLINPANIQWVILAFIFVASAASALLFKKTGNIAFLFLMGILVVSGGLSSASVFMLIIPAIATIFWRVIFNPKNIRIYLAGIFLILSAVAIYEIIRIKFFPNSLPLIAFSAKNQLTHMGEEEIFQSTQEINKNSLLLHLYYLQNVITLFYNYISPLVSEAKTIPFMGLCLAPSLVLSVFSLNAIFNRQNKIGEFEVFLFTGTVIVCLAIGLYRGLSYGIFNYRFVNLPLLYAFSTIYLSLKASEAKKEKVFICILIGIYLIALSYVNLRQSGKYIFFRNHLNSTPVSYSLDIHNWGLVEEIAGMQFGVFDFDFVQKEKIKLKQNHFGIYASEAYLMLGKNILSLKGRSPKTCRYSITRRTQVSEQPAYRIDGQAWTSEGKSLGRVFLTDNAGIVVGYGGSVTKYQQAYESIFLSKSWMGLANLAGHEKVSGLRIYAYSDKIVCEPYNVSLENLDH